MSVRNFSLERIDSLCLARQGSRNVELPAGQIVWVVARAGNAFLLVNPLSMSEVGWMSKGSRSVIATHLSRRQFEDPPARWRWDGSQFTDPDNYIVPSWSHMRQYVPRSRFIPLYGQINGDIVIVGRPALNETLVCASLLPVSGTIYIIGRTYTKALYGPGQPGYNAIHDMGVHVIFIEGPISSWCQLLSDNMVTDIKSVSVLMFSLLSIDNGVSDGISAFSCVAHDDTRIIFSGLPEGSASTPVKPSQLDNVPFVLGSMASRDVVMSTSDVANGIPMFGTLRYMFSNQPTIVPPTQELGQFLGMPLDQVVETDYSYYSVERSSISDQEWEVAAGKMSASAAKQGIPTGPVSQNGITFLGPDWASRHAINWMSWRREAAAAGVSSQTVVVIGVFEGLSVLLWTMLGGVSPPLIYAIDPGRTLDGPWGTPRVCYMHDNIPANVRPLIGQSGIVLPMLAARLAYSGEKVGIVEVDGSHHADDVLLDCEYSWRILETGGLLILDDYSDIAGPLYKPIDSRIKYTATRGIHAFMHLHRGEYRVLDSVENHGQLCLQKTYDSGTMIGTFDTPYDMDGNWQNDANNGQLYRVGPLRRPHLPELRAEDGDVWYDAESNEDMALGGVIAATKASVQPVAGALHLAAHANKNIGGGFEQLGEYIGQGQQHNAVAGLGNMFKSFGNAALGVSKGLTWGAQKAAEVWVPKENRWW